MTLTSPGSMRLEGLLAWRYLRGHGGDGFISLSALFSLLGVGLGVAALIIVMSVMNGFRAELTERIIGMEGHVKIQKYGDFLYDYAVLAQQYQNQPGVVSVTPLIYGQVMATNEATAKGIFVRGISVADLQNQPLLSNNVIAGALTNLEQERVIAIGARMAEDLGLAVKDQLRVISPHGRITPFGTVPRTQIYEIGAIFEVGMTLYDRNIAFMELAQAKSFFATKGGVSALDVRLDAPESAEKKIPQLRQIADDLLYISWQKSNEQYFAALAIERTVMFVILSLIILVAGLNIISSLTMLVHTKRREIAILRTMGASRSSILRIFFFAGAMIGACGVVVGAALGISGALYAEEIRQAVSALLGVRLFDPEVYFFSPIAIAAISARCAWRFADGACFFFYCDDHSLLAGGQNEPGGDFTRWLK